MNRRFLFLLAVLTAFAARPVYAWNPLDKLGRGICDVVFCFLELPRHMGTTVEHSGDFAGITTGVLKGLGAMGLRLVSGVYEIVTFPIPLPSHYRPVMYPEYIFYEYPSGTRYDIGARRATSQ